MLATWRISSAYRKPDTCWQHHAALTATVKPHELAGGNLTELGIGLEEGEAAASVRGNARRREPTRAPRAPPPAGPPRREAPPAGPASPPPDEDDDRLPGAARPTARHWRGGAGVRDGQARVDEQLLDSAGSCLVGYRFPLLSSSLGTVSFGGTAIPLYAAGSSPLSVGWPGIELRERVVARAILTSATAASTTGTNGF